MATHLGKRHSIAALAFGVFAAASAVGAIYFTPLCTRPSRLVDPSDGAAAQLATDSEPDWCAPGFAPVPGACLALPGDKEPTRGLIVYLHGRYARESTAEETDRQRRLAVRASHKGFAVLALRSTLGVCSAAELTNWYCWPTSEPAVNPDALLRWSAAIDAAQGRVRAGKRYLLGFSSGGYFASMLVSRAWLGFDAVAVAHGGPVEPMIAHGPKPPMLLLSADDDVAQVDMIRLAADLRHEGWPFDAYARDGTHDLADSDIDAALAFFARSEETLPLRPPLALHRPALHVREAASDEPEDSGDDEGERREGRDGEREDTEEVEGGVL